MGPRDGTAVITISRGGKNPVIRELGDVMVRCLINIFTRTAAKLLDYCVKLKAHFLKLVNILFGKSEYFISHYVANIAIVGLPSTALT